jgi:hypothetical protein
MPRLSTLGPLVGLLVAGNAGAQTSLAACGQLPDSTARQAIIQDGGLRVCLLALRADPADTTPRQWATRSHVVILETQQYGDFRRLSLDRGTAWTVNGRQAQLDSTVEAWQRAVVDVLDAAYDADRLRSLAVILQANDIPLPTNPDSARARLAAIDKRLASLKSRIANTEALDESLDGQIAAADARREGASMQALAAQDRAGAASAQVDAASTPQARAQAAQEARAAQSQAQAAQGEAMRANSRYGDLVTRKRNLNARVEIRRMQIELQTLSAQQDLLQLQLQRLDPTDPTTMRRASIEQEVATRQSVVGVQLNEALKRLRALLVR